MNTAKEENLTLLLKHYDSFLSHSDEMIYILDSELNILRYNKACLEVWKKLPRDINNINFISDFFKDYHLADNIKELYNEAIFKKQAQKILGINFNRINNYVLLIIDLTPILSKEQIVIALEYKAYKPELPIHWYKLPLLIQKASNTRCTLGGKNNGIDIREQEIMFLIFHFDTYQEIATILSLVHKENITPNAVGKIIRRKLYPRFNVIDNKGLKEKAIAINAHKDIPKSLLVETVINISQL